MSYIRNIKYLAGLLLVVGLIASFLFGKDAIQVKDLVELESTETDSIMTADIPWPDSTLMMPKDSMRTDTFSYLGTPYQYFILDTRKHQVDFLLHDSNGINIAYLDSAIAKLEQIQIDPLFATNAGIFMPNLMPEGLFINQGEELQELNAKSGQGNFYLKPNGVFYIQYDGTVGAKETQDFADEVFEVDYATQSGPLLLNQGMIHPKFNQGSPNLRTRSGVGIISHYEAIFLLSQTPVNFYDFAITFKERFGCQDALYLDGVISEFYLRSSPDQNNDQRFSGIIVVSKRP
ncbi:MAG: phosphodiester glycosidase family protein, partial [Bacteroidota bacterium]